MSAEQSMRSLKSHFDRQRQNLWSATLFSSNLDPSRRRWWNSAKDGVRLKASALCMGEVCLQIDTPSRLSQRGGFADETKLHVPTVDLERTGDFHDDITAAALTCSPALRIIDGFSFL